MNKSGYRICSGEEKKIKTFIVFSTSPPQRVRNETRKGLHVGFKLFFITCANSFVTNHAAVTVY